MWMVISLPALSHTVSHCLISLPARKQNHKKIPIFILRRHCSLLFAPKLSLGEYVPLNPLHDSTELHQQQVLGAEPV